MSFVANVAGDSWTRSDEERASPPFGVLSSEGGKKALHTLASLGGRQYLAVRGDGVLGGLDGVTGREVWRITAVGLGDIQDVQLNPERRDVLLMVNTAWRVFRLADGFAVSALIAPPPVFEQSNSGLDLPVPRRAGARGGIGGQLRLRRIRVATPNVHRGYRTAACAPDMYCRIEDVGSGHDPALLRKMTGIRKQRAARQLNKLTPPPPAHKS